jgi:hypothetical protein
MTRATPTPMMIDGFFALFLRAVSTGRDFSFPAARLGLLMKLLTLDTTSYEEREGEIASRFYC